MNRKNGTTRRVRAPRQSDEILLAECIRLAAKGSGHVSPNPMVGAVLVKDERIVARGYHRHFGGPHAEADCLRNFAGDPAGLTLYVNLEPCSHHGKTPPCVELIKAASIREVVVGMTDPNPRVRGRGVRLLRRAGIRVRTGILKRESRALNREFIIGITQKRPFIHVKIAQSLDGFIAAGRGRQTLVSSKASRTMVHRWRSEHDAVFVGAGTIRTDDPGLTVRYARGRDPHVVVLDGRFSIPESARVVRTARRRRVIVCASSRFVERRAAKRKRLVGRGVEIVEFPSKSDGLKLRDVLAELYRRDIGSLLVEGGSEVFSAFLKERLVDRLSVFVAPRIFGGGVSAFRGCSLAAVIQKRSFSISRSGRDALLRWERQ